MEQTRGMRIVSWLGVILGALSFLSLLEEPWRLIGLLCAAGAVILGRTGRKSPNREKARWSIAAAVLGAAGALTFVLVSVAGGVRIPNTL